MSLSFIYGYVSTWDDSPLGGQRQTNWQRIGMHNLHGYVATERHLPYGVHTQANRQIIGVHVESLLSAQVRSKSAYTACG